MLTVGLTGQSGAGKGVFSSSVQRIDGVYVLDTDKTAREVVEKGEKCLEELTEYFGKDILNGDGTLNRRSLADIAFCDEEKHQALNRITHFHIMKKVRAWLDECKRQGAVCAVIDAPLLFESGSDVLCDVTVGIIAPRQYRLERIMLRDGIDESRAKMRLGCQPQDSFYREKCNFILENSASNEEFSKKAYEFMLKLIKDNLTKGAC